MSVGAEVIIKRQLDLGELRERGGWRSVIATVYTGQASLVG